MRPAPEAPELRPAEVVRLWGEMCANVVVTLNGWNDSDEEIAAIGIDRDGLTRAFASSASLGAGIREFRWPEPR